jgi:hypothetical protein
MEPSYKHGLVLELSSDESFDNPRMLHGMHKIYVFLEVSSRAASSIVAASSHAYNDRDATHSCLLPSSFWDELIELAFLGFSNSLSTYFYCNGMIAAGGGIKSFLRQET